jgi:hypothetical protein
LTASRPNTQRLPRREMWGKFHYAPPESILKALEALRVRDLRMTICEFSFFVALI